MKLSISEIAWPHEVEAEAAKRLTSLGVSQVELAPARCFGDPLAADESEVRRRAEQLLSMGLAPRSFQALLFGQEGLFLFEGNESRQRMMAVLKAVAQIAGWAGAGPMVFGSPKNRLRGRLSLSEADKIAKAFFSEIGDFCAECGTCLVLEANPEQYGADYITRLDQAAELVAAVNSPGFRLHIDAGGLALSAEDFAPVIVQAANLVAHVHASQPMLTNFDKPAPVHPTLADVLKKINYQGDIAIEMKSQETGLEAVEQAVHKVRELYRLDTPK